MDAPAAAPVIVREQPRQTVLLELDLIDLGKRLRTVNGGTVQYLAESMKLHGLQYPIQVRMDGDRYALVSGAHRVQAARFLAWPHIEAFVLDLLDEDTLALLEIDENLMRAELNPLDRGLFLSRRKQIYERLYPETRRGGDRRSSDFQDQNAIARSRVSSPQPHRSRRSAPTRSAGRSVSETRSPTSCARSSP